MLIPFTVIFGWPNINTNRTQHHLMLCCLLKHYFLRINPWKEKQKWTLWWDFIFVVQLSCSVMSKWLWPHGLQHVGFSHPSPTPGACSNSCPSSQWCHPTILSSAIPPSSCFQPFPVSGSFLMNQFFELGSQISFSKSSPILTRNRANLLGTGVC